MAADVLRFVDSVSASATTRLDLNDDTAVLHVREVQWNPPRLRRSVSQNMLRDGGHVGPSSYDLRTLVLTFDVIASDVDTLATHLQNLARELDRETNWLKYQPTGATHPVFFKTYRSDITGFVDVPAAVAFRQLTVEIVTDPHALGLEVSQSFTVDNDPAGGTNGAYVDITAIGDVEVRPRWQIEETLQAVVVSSRRTGTPSDLVFYVQAENGGLGLGTDTANPGGGPSALYSGSGTNNYVSTSFATATTMTTRVTWQMATTTHTTYAQRKAIRGLFRVFAAVSRTDNADVVQVRAGVSASGVTYNDTVTVPRAGGSRQLLDLGIVSLGDRDSGDIANYPPTLVFQAARTSGTATLIWDAFLLLPADEFMFRADAIQSNFSSLYVDCDREVAVGVAAGSDPFGATPTVQQSYAAEVSGSFPTLSPGTTRWFLQGVSDNLGDPFLDVTDSFTLNVVYNPRYTTVRPVSS